MSRTDPPHRRRSRREARVGRGLERRSDAGTPRPHRGGGCRHPRLPARERPRARGGRRHRPPPRGRRARSDPSPAFRSRSRTCSVTTDMPSTSGSRILEGYLSPFDATVVARSRAAGLVPLGKTNMDEFAMGSSTEHSAYGPTHNPWDLDRIPGGSGGGSAAAVAAFEAPLALGSDTGGSIRQPAHVTGTVGLKPTYGGVSRYGAIALASSPRPGRSGHPHRAGRRSAARRHRRSRSARLDVADRRLAVVRRRRPRGCSRRRAARACGSASSSELPDSGLPGRGVGIASARLWP